MGADFYTDDESGKLHVTVKVYGPDAGPASQNEKMTIQVPEDSDVYLETIMRGGVKVR